MRVSRVGRISLNTRMGGSATSVDVLPEEVEGVSVGVWEDDVETEGDDEG